MRKRLTVYKQRITEVEKDKELLNFLQERVSQLEKDNAALDQAACESEMERKQC